LKDLEKSDKKPDRKHLEMTRNKNKKLRTRLDDFPKILNRSEQA
jgi:hypothetical protein